MKMNKVNKVTLFEQKGKGFEYTLNRLQGNLYDIKSIH